MNVTRRRLLTGLIAAPIVITTPGLLMPVKALELDLSGYMIVKYVPEYADPGAFSVDYPHWNRPPGTYSEPAKLLAIDPKTGDAISAQMRHGRWKQVALRDDYDYAPETEQARYDAAFESHVENLANAPATMFQFADSPHADRQVFHAVRAPKTTTATGSYVTPDGEHVPAQPWDHVISF